MGQNMKLKKYIKISNKLIDMPYNQLNLDNYLQVLFKTFNYKLRPGHTNDHGNVISLMSGLHENAGCISTREIDHSKSNIIIVGKGILFDSGGYSLKRNMLGMHTDMAGMAIAMATAHYCNIELGLSNVYAYCPVSANLLHNSNIMLGDKIPIGDKIVQVDNTDAEGRLILASALSNLKPDIKKTDIVVTIATLTGACAYAVGDRATAVLGGNKIVKQYLKASKKVGELAAQLPLWKYLQADYNQKTISNTNSDSCGTITAAMFLKQFVAYAKQWVHLDIATSSCNMKDKPTGVPIRTLIEFIKTLEKGINHE
jgi:leucyl aminopeptidase